MRSRPRRELAQERCTHDAAQEVPMRLRCSTGRTPISARPCRGRTLTGCCRGAGSMSATSSCRAWRMWSSCARRMRTRRSGASTRSTAKRLPGVIAVVTGQELAAVITPWVGVLSHLKGLKSAPQHAIAIDRVCWQGEAVAAVVATSRAVAEDAAELVAVEYEELEAVTDMRTRARSGDAGHPCFAWRQSRLRAQSQCRRGRSGVSPDPTR